jgi:hypothetical protein
MMGQTMIVAAEKAGRALRRRILLLLMSAVMVALMAALASPALADHSFDSDFGDQELESGSVEFDTSIGIDGNNNDQGVGSSQFASTGNFANQQGFGD